MKNALILHSLAGISALACACAIATPASATITFNLDNVALVDGGTLTGSFATSDDLSVLEGFSISSAGGDDWRYGTFTPTTYTLGNAINPVSWNAAQGIDAKFSSGAELRIFFADPLAATGANLAFTTTEIQPGSISRFLVSGGVSPAPAVASSVPEPATWAMMIGGFGLVGAAMRRSGKAVTSLA